MRIVVDIGHPAHVHLFRHFILEMRQRGHEVLITSVDKDIAFRLLDEHGLSYVPLGRTGKGLFRKILSIPILDYKFMKAVKDFDPDLIVGHGSIRGSHYAKLFKKHSLMLTDTEATMRVHLPYVPFSEVIASPRSFQRDFGAKHVRYEGFHELAYLHPKRFTPDEGILKELGLSREENFFVVRFIAWDATHDAGHKGFSPEGKRKLIETLKRRGRVFISAEASLPAEFEAYRLAINPAKMHDLLSLARLYIGEGATMATEAALLGTPSIYVSSLHHGVHKELSDRYGLLLTCTEEDKALEKLNELLSDPSIKQKWQQRRARLLKEKVDLTQWLVDFVERKWGSRQMSARIERHDHQPSVP
ncbi:MAG TPA: DUF354 domain-containing protein [Candidatus Omnitrophota bacterium]|nr:DUF354 domain-containing protein [Candidatus Omnitrophota bacterium]